MNALPQPGEVWVNEITGKRWKVVSKSGRDLLHVMCKDRDGRRYTGEIRDWELGTIAHRVERVI